MLEIVQAGQSDKIDYLIDMHRLRKRIFRDRMSWDVNISDGGLEVDQFDLPETIYLLALDDSHRVIGNWRLMPTTGPTMIRDVWPEFLETIDIPSVPYAWEASRFGVEVAECDDTDASLAKVTCATQELFCGLTELSILCGIRQIYTMYDMRIARLLKRLNCKPSKISKRLNIAGTLAEVGMFDTNDAMLADLREASNIQHRLVTPDMLPPLLQTIYESRSGSMHEKSSPDGMADYEVRLLA